MKQHERATLEEFNLFSNGSEKNLIANIEVIYGDLGVWVKSINLTSYKYTNRVARYVLNHVYLKKTATHQKYTTKDIFVNVYLDEAVEHLFSGVTYDDGETAIEGVIICDRDEWLHTLKEVK